MKKNKKKINQNNSFSPTSIWVAAKNKKATEGIK
jgi:hypothetical protein